MGAKGVDKNGQKFIKIGQKGTPSIERLKNTQSQ